MTNMAKREMMNAIDEIATECKDNLIETLKTVELSDKAKIQQIEICFTVMQLAYMKYIMDYTGDSPMHSTKQIPGLNTKITCAQLHSATNNLSALACLYEIVNELKNSNNTIQEHIYEFRRGTD